MQATITAWIGKYVAMLKAAARPIGARGAVLYVSTDNLWIMPVPAGGSWLDPAVRTNMGSKKMLDELWAQLGESCSHGSWPSG